MALDAALKTSPELVTERERPAIDGAVAALRAARAGTDPRAIQDAIDALDRASKDFAQGA